jgi:hypothetical protein
MVRKIRQGRGALMRVRKREKPEKELVGSWIQRVAFFSSDVCAI